MMKNNFKLVIGGAAVALALIAISIVQKNQSASGFLAFLKNGKLDISSSSTSSVIANNKNQPASDFAFSQPCVFNPLANPDMNKVVFKEIAWAGDKDGASNEWLSFKKISGGSIDVSGYQIINQNNKIQIILPPKTFLTDSDPVYVVARNNNISGVNPDLIFSGAIKNSNEGLELFDGDCRLLDEVSANPDWPAGKAAPDYLPAERAADLSWYTYGEEPTSNNSAPLIAISSSSLISGVSSQDNNSSSLAAITPTSSPVILAEPQLVASTSSISQPSVLPSGSPAKVLISEIMAGAEGNSSYEFIELYNAGSQAADLTGWAIKKKSSSGKESTLVVSSRFEGAVVPAGGYLLLANGSGYTGAVSADLLWPSSYTLAYTNNGLTLYNQNGEAADAISWSNIPAGKSFSRVSWNGSNFIVTDPTPQNSSS
ncbi:MAG: lamin tail domain-containing protein [Patescibacteria group bacterium]|nr:lamin tail domain-containing protein [Patescibacteria group bacterium]